MESDSWSRFSRRHHQSALQSQYDLYLGFEDFDGGEDESLRADFPCPFCGEDFDIAGLCCHIDDEHPVEAKNGVCPVCAARVGMDMVGHITMQHGNFFKMQRQKRFRRGSSGSHSTLSLLRKELREGNLQALLGGSSYSIAPSNAVPDPLLSSLIYSLPVAESSSGVQTESLGKDSLVSKSSDMKVVESVEPTLPDKDQKEGAQRSKFVQGLLLSTIFDDDSI